jgi:hypothetical protein
MLRKVNIGFRFSFREKKNLEKDPCQTEGYSFDSLKKADVQRPIAGK